jgi:hypothetical protein
MNYKHLEGVPELPVTAGGVCHRKIVERRGLIKDDSRIADRPRLCLMK